MTRFNVPGDRRLSCCARLTVGRGATLNEMPTKVNRLAPPLGETTRRTAPSLLEESLPHHPPIVATTSKPRDSHSLPSSRPLPPSLT